MDQEYVIGITGHCDLRTPEETIRRALDKIFREKKKEHTRFRILSALAPGADMIFFAQAHDSLEDSEVSYEIILPFEAELYKEKQEKGHPEWRDLFESYCEKYRCIDAKKITGIDTPRYFPAGKYIADEADLLIAVWDGQCEPGKLCNGGTAHVVHYALGLDPKQPSARKHPPEILQIHACQENAKVKKPYIENMPSPSEGDICVVELDKRGKPLFFPKELEESARCPLMIGVLSGDDGNFDSAKKKAEEILNGLKGCLPNTPFLYLDLSKDSEKNCADILDLLIIAGEKTEDDPIVEAVLSPDVILPSDRTSVNVLKITRTGVEQVFMDNDKKLKTEPVGSVIFDGSSRVLRPFSRSGGNSIRIPSYWELKESFHRELMKVMREQQTCKKLIDEIRKESVDRNGCERNTVRHRFCANRANTNRAKYDRLLLFLFLVSFVAGLSAQLYGGIDHNFAPRFCSFFLFAYLVLAAAVFCFRNLIAKLDVLPWNRFHGSYLNYRVLAEALRVQRYWVYVGLSCSVAEDFQQTLDVSNDFCVKMLKQWFVWDTINPPAPGTASGEEKKAKALNMLAVQQKYYAKQAKKWNRRNMLSNGGRWFFLVFSYFMACVLAFGIRKLGSLEFEPVSGLLVGIGPFIFAAISFFMEKKSFGILAQNYTIMENDFGCVLDKIARGSLTSFEQQDMIHQLGVNALKEHHAWLARYSGSKPEPMI